ncbi:TetR/AcrR family transcriptional regulator [Portibacter lacus]|uniref:TetR family transcriptional regulator n=1 Tax=Portibacter lacus TaxID=1099794 RepID=A0AA37SPH2_9BACT|nr:TetR/AcrR family transcriptional regulator [Portibacter lacus]GLR17389.1 TetR family transcriptional regulator [Portibacter lacus]
MTSSTKEKIRIAALKLFNRDGLVNVRLQHIADEAFISVGNLAYHYPNKESILSALYERLSMQQKALLAEFRIVPLFDNIDRLIQQTFLLQRQYVFFYFDTLEIIRAYPKIGEAHQDHISSQISQLKIILDFNTSRGALNAEPIDGVYDKLAIQKRGSLSEYSKEELEQLLRQVLAKEDYESASKIRDALDKKE